MRFQMPLIRATLLRRYKRFLSDHELEDGSAVTAHCANPGSMMGLVEPGSETWLSRSDNPKRKLAHTWELIRVGDGLVGIHALQANRLAEEAIRDGVIPELAGYGTVRREVRYGEKARIDFLLEEADRPPCYVEVKNVHLRRAGGAEFPDGVTARGARHLRELAGVVARGGRAVMLYVVQRTDCDDFALASDIDPAYAEAFAKAHDEGVEALCYACSLDPTEIRIDRALPILSEGFDG